MTEMIHTTRSIRERRFADSLEYRLSFRYPFFHDALPGRQKHPTGVLFGLVHYTRSPDAVYPHTGKSGNLLDPKVDTASRGGISREVAPGVSGAVAGAKMPTDDQTSALERAIILAGEEWYQPIGARASAELWASEGFSAAEFEALVPTRCFDPVVARAICEHGLLERACELTMSSGVQDTIGHALMRGTLTLRDLMKMNV